MIAILIFIVVVTLAFWAWAHYQLAGRGRPVRWIVAGFVALQLSLVVTQYAERRYWIIPPVPASVRTIGYVWGLAIVPFLVAPTLVASGIGVLARRLAAWRRRSLEAAPEPVEVASRRLARRRFLSTAAATAPLATTALVTGKALYENGTFRVIDRALLLPTLPAGLEGLRIAHVSDLHCGRFMTGPMLDRVGEVVRLLRPDLVCFTGDLVDFDHRHLRESLALLESFHAPYGTWVVEGNHDLFQGRAPFERALRAAGLRFLRNETARIDVGGTVLELSGLGWGDLDEERAPVLDANMAALVAARTTPEVGGYRILLAHHPHAFDLAQVHGFPLTLAGHTHGGQLMWSRSIGIGAALFRYLSGEYAAGDARLVVSNGVGNWFPLRIGAPAEVVLLRLSRSDARREDLGD